MFRNIKEDLKAALERDPAARNALEVILCYPVSCHSHASYSSLAV